jgi:hypothetical protein
MANSICIKYARICGGCASSGEFTIKGEVSGSTTIALAYLLGITYINSVAVTYQNFTDESSTRLVLLRAEN